MSSNDLLMQQQQMTDNINQLLQQSSQSLLCGPGTECQKTQNSENLQQKYIQSKTNLQMAPMQEQTAEKNYYTNKLGDSGYNNMQQEKYSEKSTRILNEIQTKFNKNLSNASELNNTLQSLNINYQNVVELFDNYVRENSALKNKLNLFNTDLVTNDRKTFYETQNYDILKYWFTIWLWVYISVFAVFTLSVFFKNHTYSMGFKIFLFVLFAIYPFIINTVVIYLITIFTYLYSLLPKNVYTSL